MRYKYSLIFDAESDEDAKLVSEAVGMLIVKGSKYRFNSKLEIDILSRNILQSLELEVDE